jgi:hypothetical protein
MRQGSIALRLAPLLAAGALALHKLNGLAGADALAGHGHSYLPLAAALVTVLLAIACARFARELWQASRGRLTAPAAPSFTTLWLLATSALLATFALQEWIEGWITPGHPATIGHALAHIGWTTPALAVGLGCVIALLVRGSRSAIELLARRHHLRRRAPRPLRGRWARLPTVQQPRPSVLAANRAGRAPPGVSFA